jgi:hypothetical protein
LVTTKINAKVFNDNIMREVGISVDTFEGNVTLTGDKYVQVLNMGSAPENPLYPIRQTALAEWHRSPSNLHISHYGHSRCSRILSRLF